MATQSASGSGEFAATLGRICALYVGGFAVFVVLLAILEQVGVPNRIVGYLFVFFTLCVYAAIGILSRTMRVSQYYVAGRGIPAIANGMATGADVTSAALFVGFAGSLYVLGHDGLAFVLGLAGGVVLTAVLVAPYLRKLGAYTVPEFLGARFGGGPARIGGVVVLIACSFVFLTVQIQAIGLVISRLIGIPYDLAILAGFAATLLCSLLGGMRGVTWTQAGQYVVLAAAYLAPVVILSLRDYGLPVPQLTYGAALSEITAIEQQIGLTGPNGEGLGRLGQFTPHLVPFSSLDPFNYFALIACLMAGTASLPHVLMRFLTVRSVRETRASAAWTLLFVLLVVVTAPAYAAFAKVEVLRSVIGARVAELPSWIYAWGAEGLGFVKICGETASDPIAVAASCGAGDAVIAAADVEIHPDVVVLAMPDIAGMPYVIVALVAAGALAAALSTANGLVLAIANSLSHDVYYRMLDRRAPTSRRLAVARLLLIGAAGTAAWLASMKPGTMIAMVTWAFSLAAAGNFPALVLGIWWKRCTAAGAAAGMAAGFGITLFYLLATEVAGMPPWPIPGMTDGVASAAAAVFGLPVGFAVTIAVSYLSPEPPPETLQLVDDFRRPRGESVAHSGEAAS